MRTERNDAQTWQDAKLKSSPEVETYNCKTHSWRSLAKNLLSYTMAEYTNGCIANCNPKHFWGVHSLESWPSKTCTFVAREYNIAWLGEESQWIRIVKRGQVSQLKRFCWILPSWENIPGEAKRLGVDRHDKHVLPQRHKADLRAAIMVQSDKIDSDCGHVQRWRWNDNTRDWKHNNWDLPDKIDRADLPYTVLAESNREQ